MKKLLLIIAVLSLAFLNTGCYSFSERDVQFKMSLPGCTVDWSSTVKDAKPLPPKINNEKDIPTK